MMLCLSFFSRYISKFSIISSSSCHSIFISSSNLTWLHGSPVAKLMLSALASLGWELCYRGSVPPLPIQPITPSDCVLSLATLIRIVGMTPTARIYSQSLIERGVGDFGHNRFAFHLCCPLRHTIHHEAS